MTVEERMRQLDKWNRLLDELLASVPEEIKKQGEGAKNEQKAV